MLRMYMKSELGLTYKKCRPFSSIGNNDKAKYERQVAAFNYIDFLSDGKRVINIDESIFYTTDSRTMTWSPKNKRLYLKHATRLSSLSIIAGVSTSEEVFFTINRGNNNSQTFFCFLLKLVQCLNRKDINWRSNTILLMDNAANHRSASLMQKYEELQHPICFLGPYQFRSAPVEKLFSYIKNNDLNPNSNRVTTR